MMKALLRSSSTRSWTCRRLQYPSLISRRTCLAPPAAAPPPPMATSSEPKGSARVIGREVLNEGTFLRFVNLKYVSEPDLQQPRSWQAVERTTTDQKHGIDAVAAFTVIRRAKEGPRLLVVKQFRPPMNKYTIELCAGLVDPEESIEEAALRELKEETGYSGKVIGRSGRQFLSPGLTNENIVTVYVEVDGDEMDRSGVQLQQSQEDQGAIQMMTLPLRGLYEELQRLEQEGFAIYVGLYSIAQGMKLEQALLRMQQGHSFAPGLDG